MPIAFNINMLVADKNGSAALIESLNGTKAVKKIDAATSEQYLCATNHAHLPQLRPYAPQALKNSVGRENILRTFASGRKSISVQELEELLSAPYPAGLNCRYYDSFFGTLRSQIIDATAGTMSVRWGTPGLNEWHTYRVDSEETSAPTPVKLIKEAPPADFYDMIAL